MASELRISHRVFHTRAHPPAWQSSPRNSTADKVINTRLRFWYDSILSLSYGLGRKERDVPHTSSQPPLRAANGALQ